MDALARQYVRQAHAHSQHLHPDLARHWCRAFLFGDSDHLWSAVARDDDARVFHEPLAPLPSISEQSAIRQFNPARQSAISSGRTGNFLLLLRSCTIVSDAGTLPSDHPHTKWTTPAGLQVTSPGNAVSVHVDFKFPIIWLPRSPAVTVVELNRTAWAGENESGVQD